MVFGMQLLALALFVSVALCGQPLDLPLAIVPSPDEKFALVLDSGTSPGISVRDIASPNQELSRVQLPDAWLGLTFARDKKTVYVGGGSRGSVFELTLSELGELRLVREMKVSDFVGDVQLSPDGRLIYAADVFSNLIAVINPQSGRVIDRFKTGRRPYRIVFHPDGKSYFVSSWADAAVYQYSTVNGEELGRIRLGPHTTDMVLSDYKPMDDGAPPAWKYRLFVAASNTNNVYAVGIGENKTMTLIDTINVAPEQNSPLGMTPSALALSIDQMELYVVCSDAGTVAAVDVSEARGVLEGFLPAATYPTAVRPVGTESLLITTRANGLSILSAGVFAAQSKLVDTIRRRPEIRYVLYIVPKGVPKGDAETYMRAIGSIAPDFTVKMAKYPQFGFGDAANLPPAGYLWTNVLAAGQTVQNYGVFMRAGQPMDPALKPFSEPDTSSFLADLKDGEASGDMPNLILINSDDPRRQDVIDAVKKSKFGFRTIIIDSGDTLAVADALGLAPMTRRDAIRQ